MALINNKNILKITPYITITLIVIIWLLISVFELINPVFIPDIRDTLSSLFQLLSSKDIYLNFWATLYRAMAGLLLSIFVGVPLGLLMAKSKLLYKLLEMPIEFFRAIPSSALFPLFILFFGIGDSSKIAVVFYGCSLIMLINTYYGAISNPEKQRRIDMLTTLDASKIQILKYTIINDALPNIFSGIRVCISLSFVLVVVTEMFLGANIGLGKMLYDFYLRYYVADMYATILIIGFTSFFINKLFLRLENSFVFW